MDSDASINQVQLLHGRLPKCLYWNHFEAGFIANIQCQASWPGQHAVSLKHVLGSAEVRLSMSWARPGYPVSPPIGTLRRTFNFQLQSNRCAHLSELVQIQRDLLSSWQRSTITPGCTMPHKPNMTITNLPTDVLSCIIQHLQQDIGQRDQTLDDVAALRSTCRSLRHAMDPTVTHARFHLNVDVEELRNVTRRCTGDDQYENHMTLPC